MHGESVMYEGRLVPVENFRAVIYSFDGKKKIVDSWDAYKAQIGTGLWFSNPESVKESSEQVYEDVHQKKEEHHRKKKG